MARLLCDQFQQHKVQVALAEHAGCHGRRNRLVRGQILQHRGQGPRPRSRGGATVMAKSRARWTSDLRVRV